MVGVTGFDLRLPRVKFEAVHLKPFARFAFPHIATLRKHEIWGGLGDELVTSLSTLGSELAESLISLAREVREESSQINPQIAAGRRFFLFLAG